MNVACSEYVTWKLILSIYLKIVRKCRVCSVFGILSCSFLWMPKKAEAVECYMLVENSVLFYVQWIMHSVLSVFPSKNISHSFVKNGNKQPNNQSQSFRRKHAETQHIYIFNVNSLFLSFQTSPIRNTFPSSFFTLFFNFNFFARIGNTKSNQMNKLKITRKTSAIELHFLIEKFLEVFVFRFWLFWLFVHLYFVYCLPFFFLVKRKLMNS